MVRRVHSKSSVQSVFKIVIIEVRFPVQSKLSIAAAVVLITNGCTMICGLTNH